MMGRMDERDIIAAGIVILHDDLGPAIVDAGDFPVGFFVAEGPSRNVSVAGIEGELVFVRFEGVTVQAFNDFTVTHDAGEYHLLTTIQPIGQGPRAYQVGFTLLAPRP